MGEPLHINDFTVSVHERVFRLSCEIFKDELLRSLKSLIPFDMAIWGSGVQDPQLIFSIATHDFPLERLMDYSARWQPNDPLRQAVGANPGRALRNEDIAPIEEHYASDIYQAFCGPAGIEHALGIAIVDPVTQAGELIFLFRRQHGHFFSDLERDAMALIMPHLAAAWRHRQILQFRTEARNAVEASAVLPSGHAIIDNLGQVHASDPDFGWGVRACFPDWIGPKLPDGLMPILHGDTPFHAIGSHRFRIARGRDRHVLALAGPAAEMPISPAEHRVAVLYAEGRTAADVATVLGISPLTVRNHLTAIYAKVGLHSKVALAKWLATLS